MKKFLLYLTLSIVFLGLTVPVVSAKGKHSKTKIKVMTRNLYLGADIFRVVEAAQNPDPDLGPLSVPVAVAEVFQTMLNTDFWERAEAIAHEIAKAKPDVIGLQEVSTYYIQNPGQPEEIVIDFYAVLLAALLARGMHYQDFMVTNADVELPMFVPNPGAIPPYYFSKVRLVDHDYVLAREDLDASPVSADNYRAFLPLNLEGTIVELLRGYVIVDVEIEDETFRFANTHLEVSGDPGSPFRIAQAAQMFELLGTLNHLANVLGYEPTIMVGDFNSSPEDVSGVGYYPDELDEYGMPLGDAEGIHYVPPYMQAIAAEYIDAWSFRPGKKKPRKEKRKGFTCCQDEDLHNKKSALYERIDLIFSSEPPKKIKAKVIGKGKKDKTPSKKWPSDHAGVAADMQFEMH